MFNRADYLESKHITQCQGDIGKFDTGFLGLGELPEMNAEDFKMVLGLVGMPLYDSNGEALIEENEAIPQS